MVEYLGSDALHFPGDWTLSMENSGVGVHPKNKTDTILLFTAYLMNQQLHIRVMSQLNLKLTEEVTQELEKQLKRVVSSAFQVTKSKETDRGAS